jgi:hypothetical protein
MVSAGYSGLKASPSSGFFVCCMESKTHEYSRSLGRLLGRAAAVSAIIERIERMGSSTKEARLFHKLTAKSRPSKKILLIGRAIRSVSHVDCSNNERPVRKNFFHLGTTFWLIARPDRDRRADV